MADIPYGYCHCGCGRKTRIATRNDSGSGMVKGQPMRYLRNHYGPPAQPMPVKFWRHVTKGDPDACWEWAGARDDEGYGCLCIYDTHIGAHRASWEIANGPIPKGLDVLHKCDNRACCNPGHLFLGTQSDNSRDMVSKGRQKHVNGSKHHFAKLHESDIPAIRALYASGYRQEQVAEKYHVDQTLISLIVRRLIWKHVK